MRFVTNIGSGVEQQPEDGPPAANPNQMEANSPNQPGTSSASVSGSDERAVSARNIKQETNRITENNVPNGQDLTIVIFDGDSSLDVDETRGDLQIESENEGETHGNECDNSMGGNDFDDLCSALAYDSDDDIEEQIQKEFDYLVSIGKMLPLPISVKEEESGNDEHDQDNVTCEVEATDPKNVNVDGQVNVVIDSNAADLPKQIETVVNVSKEGGQTNENSGSEEAGSSNNAGDKILVQTSTEKNMNDGVAAANKDDDFNIVAGYFEVKFLVMNENEYTLLNIPLNSNFCRQENGNRFFREASAGKWKIMFTVCLNTTIGCKMIRLDRIVLMKSS